MRLSPSSRARLVLITAGHLAAAADAHLERMAGEIGDVLDRERVDAGEVCLLANALSDLRRADPRRVYAGGLIDGIVLGVRAARLAHGESP